jgi:hypothetical protein
VCCPSVKQLHARADLQATAKELTLCRGQDSQLRLRSEDSRMTVSG